MKCLILASIAAEKGCLRCSLLEDELDRATSSYTAIITTTITTITTTTTTITIIIINVINATKMIERS